MSWFRVDDTLAAHPKVRRAGLAAMGLWTVAGSWSSQQLTEGFVPEWFVATWPQGKKLAAQLVGADLWVTTADPEPGWTFHDWTDCNPTADKERERRQNARKRQAKWREKAAEKRETERNAAAGIESGSRVSSRVTDGVSDASRNGSPFPSPPDPSRPLISYGDEKADESILGGNATEVDARDPNEPPKCPKHRGKRREEVPDCWACGQRRVRWEAAQAAAAEFPRDPWCGDDECDPITRLRETPFGVIRCPECHPLAEEASA